MTSSTIPSGVTVEQSTNCSTVEVFLREPWRLNFSIMSLAITLMAAPRSIKVWGIMVPLMWTLTTWPPGSRYFGQITYPNIRSDSCPKTLIVGASLFHLPGSLKHFSLVILLYIGTSFMAWRRGIFTHNYFSSPRSLVSSEVGCVVSVSLSGKGGMTLSSLSLFSSSSSLGGGWLSRRTFLDRRLISWISIA